MTAYLDLPVGSGALAAARRVVESTLVGWGFADRQDVGDAVLVTNELVANAVRHGGGCLSLHLHSRSDEVTICAVDGSAVVPRHRDPDGDGGRGLRIIEAVCRAWGVEDLGEGGKRVWVRLARSEVRRGGSVAAVPGRGRALQAQEAG
ncbi:ATP-binding protein [Micromonospora sp. R77]|uniref:ATP-binding protein n=1 Tax=Micromonospora sp. R77 TaxID=2925836 RepID=UPI001F6158B3|nr:ATP-binding protein [Micromonospora sp. R77]MCI4066789.1 ATP-binding protein [Micromonospora sp. R77]